MKKAEKTRKQNRKLFISSVIHLRLRTKHVQVRKHEEECGNLLKGWVHLCKQIKSSRSVLNSTAFYMCAFKEYFYCCLEF
jgi:hypothetical protein